MALNISKFLPKTNVVAKAAAPKPAGVNPFLTPLEPMKAGSLKVTQPNLRPNIPVTAVSTQIKGADAEINQARKTQTELLNIPKNSFANFALKANETMDIAHEDFKKSVKEKGSPSMAPSSKLLGKQTETLMAGVIAALSPLGMAMKAGEKVPVVGEGFKIVNKAFEVADNLFRYGAKKGFNAIPDAIISAETKKNWTPAIGDVAGFLGQVILAKGAVTLKGKVMPKAAMEDLNNKYVENVKRAVEGHKGEVTSEVAHNIAFKAAKKTITDMGELDINFKAQKVGNPVLDLNKTGEFVKFPDNLTNLQRARIYDEVKNAEFNKDGQVHISQADKMTGRRELTLGDAAAKYPEVAKTLENYGIDWKSEEFTPRVSSALEQSFKDKGLLPENWENMSRVEKITHADQGVKTAELIKNNIDEARAILRGEKPLPADMRSGFFMEGMREVAEKSGDVQLVHEIMNSPLVKETSMHAQELESYKAMQPDSIVTQAADIIKARNKNIEKTHNKTAEKVKKETAKEIKNEVDKVAPKPKDWAEFLETIKCKY